MSSIIPRTIDIYSGIFPPVWLKTIAQVTEQPQNGAVFGSVPLPDSPSAHRLEPTDANREV